MEKWIMSMFLLIPVLVAFVFYYAIRKRNELSDVERDQKLVEIFTGGGRFYVGMLGGAKLSFPFVQVRLYEKFMVISYFRKLVFNYDEIELKQGLFNLEIIHRNENYPTRVIVMVAREQQLVDYVERKRIEYVS